MPKVIGESKIARHGHSANSYAHIIVELEYTTNFQSRTIVWNISEKIIPNEFRDAVVRGISRALSEMAIFSLYKYGVSVVGGSYHDVDSHNQAFEDVAFLATNNAINELPRNNEGY